MYETKLKVEILKEYKLLKYREIYLNILDQIESKIVFIVYLLLFNYNKVTL